MASLIDIVISYIIYYLPSVILTLLAPIVGILVYFQGKKKNRMIMDDSIKSIKQATKDFVSKFNLAETSTNGRTYLLDVKPDQALKDLRIHFTMINRHLILSKIASLFRKRRDYLLIEAEPSDKIVKRYQLEIVPKAEQKSIKALVDMLGKLETIEIGSAKLDEMFLVRGNDAEFLLTALKIEKRVVQILYAQRDYITRLSYYPLQSPSIRVVAEMREGMNPKLLIEVLNTLTRNMIDLGKKGYYTKQRAIGLRVIEDKSLEKGKKERR